MIYRHLLFLCTLVSALYRIVLRVISWRQRKKPLPEEVQTIYSPERWQQFINRQNDYLPLFILHRVFNLILNIIVIYSGFFRYIEQLAGENVYRLFLVTFGIMFVIDLCMDIPESWYSTFVIEEKYGLNKKDKREFWKDELISTATELFLSIPLFLILIRMVEYLAKKAMVFSGRLLYAFLFLCGLGVLFYALVMVLVIAAFCAGVVNK